MSKRQKRQDKLKYQVQRQWDMKNNFSDGKFPQGNLKCVQRQKKKRPQRETRVHRHT